MNVTYNRAENIIIDCSGGEDVLYEITEIVNGWPFISSDELSEIKSDINNLIDKLQNLVTENVSEDLMYALHCYVHNILHESLISQIKLVNKDRDNFIYEKCKTLINKKVSLLQLGSKIDYAYDFPAAFAELSMLDKYSSPTEKLNCLVSTFDILYAELKSVLVAMISKYSNKDNDIPIINNNEVYPSLLIVIIKSKLTYLYSNLFYIRFFCPDLSNEPSREILEHFEKASEMLYNLNENEICRKYNHNDTLETSLNGIEYHTLYNEVSNSSDEPNNFLKEARRQYCQQIDKALTQNLLS